MANICDLGYAIRPKEEFANTLEATKEMEDLAALIKSSFDIDKNGYVENGNCERFVKALGLSEDFLRICITEFKMTEDPSTGHVSSIVLGGWGKWYAYPQALAHGLSKKYGALELLYYAEEPGCMIYENSDVDEEFFPIRYCVDYSTDKNGEVLYYSSEEREKLLNDVEKLTGNRYPSVANAILTSQAGKMDEPFCEHQGCDIDDGCILVHEFNEGILF